MDQSRHRFRGFDGSHLGSRNRCAAPAPPLWHDSRVYYAEFGPDGLSVLTCGRIAVRVWADTGAR
jgi:hypothetical protein